MSNTITPFSRHLLKKYIKTAHLDIWESKQLRLIIEAKDQNALMNVPVEGLIDLFDFDPYHLRAGIGILIANQQYRRRGYATEALKLLVRYCFGILQLNQIYCNISADNPVSLQALQKQDSLRLGGKKIMVKNAKRLGG